MNTLQHRIYKISTSRLKENNWDIKINYDNAIIMGEVISLFDSQMFRMLSDIIGTKINKNAYKYVASIVISNKSDFSRVTNKKGIKINGITFKYFLGTTGGLKNNSLLFVNAQYLDELNKRCECGRNKDIPLVPAKYEAYKALTASSSIEIPNPENILVVSDALTHYYSDVIEIKDGEANPEIKDEEIEPIITMAKDSYLENNATDGYNLCTIEYMTKISQSLGMSYVPSGVCLRNAWLKGMMFPFPIKEFAEKYLNGNYMVKDIWGNYYDIRKIDLILTESSLKLWSSYKSIEDYISHYKQNGYNFAITKESPETLEDLRCLNYQYLQSYNLTDEDVEELCKPTIDWLKQSCCGDYESTISFLGIANNGKLSPWQEAFVKNKKFIDDKYIINKTKKMIYKKINDAKTGKLLCHANYQIISGDPYLFMQHVCGLKETGLLKSETGYSAYWNNENVDTVVVFRSPMTNHNNIRRLNLINNSECNFWYQYMKNIFIINSYDTFCMAENGCDFDGDTVYSTNNRVLLNKYIHLPAIRCLQKTAEKSIITRSRVLASDKRGLGNQVGTITNRATSMIDIQSSFSTDSEEYKTLDYRILTCQNFQQNELDSIKGIISNPMPRSWYEYKFALGDLEKNIVANKKPYFMIYIYPNLKREYKAYLENTKIKKEIGGCMDRFEEFLPVKMNPSTMNKICRHVEDEMDNYSIELNSKDFDYTFLKSKRKIFKKHIIKIQEILDEYKIANVENCRKSKYEYLDKDIALQNREAMTQSFREKLEQVCNIEEMLDIMLDMCYNNDNKKQYVWSLCGDLVIKRLEELENGV